MHWASVFSRWFRSEQHLTTAHVQKGLSTAPESPLMRLADGQSPPHHRWPLPDCWWDHSLPFMCSFTLEIRLSKPHAVASPLTAPWGLVDAGHV